MYATRPCDPDKEEGLALEAKHTKRGGEIFFLPHFAMDQSITQKQKVGVSYRYSPIFKTGNYFLFLFSEIVGILYAVLHSPHFNLLDFYS